MYADTSWAVVDGVRLDSRLERYVSNFLSMLDPEAYIRVRFNNGDKYNKIIADISKMIDLHCSKLKISDEDRNQIAAFTIALLKRWTEDMTLNRNAKGILFERDYLKVMDRE